MNIRTIAIALAANAVAANFALAHATLEVPEAKSNSYYKAVMRIGHGCDGQTTLKVRIKIPEGIISVKPMPKAGWSVETVKGDYEGSYSLHGKDVKSGVTEIVWSGSLEDDFYDEFVFRARITDHLPAGETVYIPTVQECADGKNAWVEIPAAGQDPHDLDSPAPGLKILPAHHDHAMSHGESK